MKKHKKTNVMRMLDQAHIPYETKSCEYTEEDLSGIHTANILGYRFLKLLLHKEIKPVRLCFAYHLAMN